MHSVLFPYRVVSPYYLYCSGVHDLFPFGGHYVDAAIYKPLWYSIAKEMYTGNMGLFPNMLVHLYLYIPLLTMGLMSREYSSGSIKLLYSSPVSSIQIIFGKFLSMMIYSLILVGILFLFVGFTAWNVPSFDMSLALSGLLGIYLVICSYAAIGLFMSCLTSYQVVAAVATLGLWLS